MSKSPIQSDTDLHLPEQTTSPERRALVTSLLCMLAGCTTSPTMAEAQIDERIRKVHERIGGRMGVHVLDTQTGRRIGYRDTTRFAMASTFKVALAAAVLSRVDQGELKLDRRIPISQADMVPYAPVTEKHLTEGAISIRECCAAMVELSDNPAANLLFPLVGGPSGLTRFLRGIGDAISRSDRLETDLNSNLPGDERDTTTPRAMIGNLEALLIGDALSDSSRALLTQWMVNSPTGAKRIRAGLPPNWRAGDKTGTGQNGAINDVAIAWPPGRKPILFAVYLSESRVDAETLNAAHADIGRLVASEVR